MRRAGVRKEDNIHVVMDHERAIGSSGIGEVGGEETKVGRSDFVFFSRGTMDGNNSGGWCWLNSANATPSGLERGLH